ncbi:BatA and WFA domain-containing protein [Ravibacter arvi]|uniref:BatA and WFA domain-containing protein n=1 Tax=Ravibacter arvi TaxID=2051041 RepID=A0ABP8LTD7_9BACT
MGFLFPTFLWGLLAVAIPLAIHLFNFRRTKRVFFTNVAFLREIETEKKSFRRLKHLLVLLARMLAIAALALAFAQPYLKREEATAVFSGKTGFYLDNSFSMQNESNHKRFVDIATGSLDEMMAAYPNFSALQLVTNDFSPEEQRLLTASEMQDRLTTIELTPTSRSLQEVYDRQKRLINRSSADKPAELYWISDFQKSTVGDLAKLSVDSADQVNLIPVQAGGDRNVFVDSVWLQVPFMRQQQKNILYVKVRNSGNEAVESLPVRLILNDSQVSASSVDISAQSTETLGFDFNLSSSGSIRGMITFDDVPVTFDNQFYFVLNASPLIRVLHVSEGPGSAAASVNRVFGNTELFLVQQENAYNLDVGRMSDSDLIVLNEVKQPSAALTGALKSFVGKGGSVLVVPPVNADEPAYLSFVSQLGVPGLKPEKGRAIPLREPDSSEPFFADVFETRVNAAERVNMPVVTPVLQWSGAGQTILAQRDGRPFLGRVTSGAGKLYLMAAPLDAENGNFAAHALFVPTMYKIAAGSVRQQKTSYHFGDRAIELDVPAARPNSVYKLKQGQNEFIPVQRLNGKQLVLEIPQKADLPGQALTPGYFELIADGKTEQVLAFNPDRPESELAAYSPAELRGVLSGRENITVFDTIDDTAFRTKFDRQAAGARLWKYFLYAALFFLLAEVLLVRLVKE